jgi:acetyl esterase/lipase
MALGPEMLQDMRWRARSIDRRGAALCPTPQEIRNPTSPLEVIVTGHSKGGALAAAVALWLEEALHSGKDDECRDPRGAPWCDATPSPVRRRATRRSPPGSTVCSGQITTISGT